MFGQGFQFEADPAHPRRRQRPVELDAVAGVDPRLTIERLTVGVLRHGDQRQKRLGGNTAFDDVVGRGGLDHAVDTTEGVLGAARHDHAEAGRHHVEAFAGVFADPDLLEAEYSAGISGSITSSIRSR